MEILTEYNNYKPVTKQEVNRALPDTQLTSPLKLHSFKKQIMSNDNKKLLVTFYLIANEEATKELITNPQRGRTWQDLYYNYTLPLESPQKRRRLNNAPVAPQPLPRRNQEICDQIGGYWKDPKSRDLFFPSSPIVETDAALSRRISLLEDLMKNPKKIKARVNRAEQCGLESHEAGIILNQCYYLRQAYRIALDSMPKKTWVKCCEEAIQRMKEMGNAKIKHSKTLRRWNKMFRRNEIFPHPNVNIEMRREYSPVLLDVYPEAREKICEWASKNIDKLSCEALVDFVNGELIQELYRRHVNECGLTCLSMDDFRKSLKIRSFSVSTSWKYLQHLGYRWKKRKKSYYNDKHESNENVKYRLEFIEKYFEYEQKGIRWVQLTEEELRKLEENEKYPLLPFLAYHLENGLYELHIDCHPDLYKMAGKLSNRMQPHIRPVIIIGQDETVFRQHTYSTNAWHDRSGATKLLPKSDGYSFMISALCSRNFGLGIWLTDLELSEINEMRLNQNYVSEESAIEINGTREKKPLTCKHALIRYFELGINAEGYWSYHHMVLQIEDAFDILSVKYPHCDFVILMDYSGPHQKMRKNGLDANQMGVRWGGKKYKMRSTIIEEVGPYQSTYQVNDEQCLQFSETDEGPFYLSAEERENLKRPCPTGKTRTRKRTKREICEDLRKEGFQPKGLRHMDDLVNQARVHNIPIEVIEEIIRPGWVNENKGLLQVLYERGWIDEENIGEYSLKGLKHQMDENKEVKDEYKTYLLRDKMAACGDFRKEKTAMEELLHQLSSKGNCKITPLNTPKYHPEIAGEGIEYAWGHAKRYFRSISLEMKNTKEKFVEAIKDSIKYVSVKNINSFAGRCRRYMLAYKHECRETRDSPPSLTYESIEKFQRNCKTH